MKTGPEQRAGYRWVLLLRHGDCRQDEVRRFLGQADLPLNDLGRAQASAWQQDLAKFSLEKIFTSDLSRCRETAEIIAAGHKCGVEPLAQLREIDLGAWDGRAMDEVRDLEPDEFRRRGENLLSYRTPDGESFADLAVRVIPLFEELIQRSNGNLLIVAHSGVNKILLGHILGLPFEKLFRLHQEYSGLSLIQAGPSGLELIGMNLHPRAVQSTLGQSA